jgi:hypothetical protein
MFRHEIGPALISAGPCRGGSRAPVDPLSAAATTLPTAARSGSGDWRCSGVVANFIAQHATRQDQKMSEPTGGMTQYQSIKRVLAGRIREVVEAGCYVEYTDGTAVLRAYDPNMTARYTPVPGDYWVIYDDGYQSISPRAQFEAGYVVL